MAVELALLLTPLMFLLLGAFVLGHVFWQYNVLKNATYSAARYVATAGTWAQLKTGAARRAAVETMAKELAAEAGVASDFDVVVTCRPANACGGSAVTSVTIGVDVFVQDPTGFWFGGEDLFSFTSTASSTN
jgi:Flp pilus assembly protein TadG